MRHSVSFTSFVTLFLWLYAFPRIASAAAIPSRTVQTSDISGNPEIVARVNTASALNNGRVQFSNRSPSSPSGPDGGVSSASSTAPSAANSTSTSGSDLLTTAGAATAADALAPTNTSAVVSGSVYCPSPYITYGSYCEPGSSAQAWTLLCSESPGSEVARIQGSCNAGATCANGPDEFDMANAGQSGQPVDSMAKCSVLEP
ncbi:hypothetical protein MMC20_003529 [Loxospora ochrophaea]|nr:hypothetical protein [Loxospora ochrophaea]